MRVLVVGASGQVARSLVECADRHEVEILARGRDFCDLTHEERIAACVEQTMPDVVVNAAAYTEVDAAEQDEAAATLVNAKGAGRLALEASKRNVPIISLSTDYVFDGSNPAPYVESDPPCPINAYGRSKLAGESAIVAANPRHIILRTAWVYSPFGRNFVKTMLRLAGEREELNVVDDQFGNPTSAHDIAEGILRIARTVVRTTSDGSWGVYHMTAEGEGSWHDLATAVMEESRLAGGPTATVKRLSTEQYAALSPGQAMRPHNSRMNCQSLEAVFGVRLPAWRHSLPNVVGRLIVTSGDLA